LLKNENQINKKMIDVKTKENENEKESRNENSVGGNYRPVSLTVRLLKYFKILFKMQFANIYDKTRQDKTRQ